MTQPLIAPIVEGYGETEAVPLLLRKIGHEHSIFPRVNPPIRVKAGSFLHDSDYFAKYVALAAAKASQGGDHGLVVIILDCEDECPAELGPLLLEKARGVRSDVEYLVFLAYREYETWFLAAAESLRNYSGLPLDLQAPPQPEAIRDAKGWLGAQMNGGYDPLRHQAAFTNQMDMLTAMNVPSFRRLFNKLSEYYSRFNM